MTPRRLAALLSLVAALAVVAIAEGIFPYHTSNHDEGVYLQQAAMLLEGQLTISPPVAESFRPWFFVADGGQLYPKYTPVAAAIFAVGGLLGSYTISLGLVAGVAVALAYAIVAEVFDRRTAVVAAALVLASPLFLVDAAVFLSYVPTFALNLLFAWAYLRADRTGDRRFAALAGAAVGLAFFSRPFTAVLFALPFVAHAVWTLRTLARPVVVRQVVTAALGLAGVAVTLGYNAVVTGDPLVFPYQAFAPRDGLGFGLRRILGYERVYDLPLALEANARVLWSYVTEWSVAAPLGVPVALGGLAVVLSRLRTDRDPWKLTLAGLFVTIPVGNVYFWGNLNILGQLSVPTDGLISFLGPYYHVGLLLPTAAFGAVALVAVGRRVRALSRDQSQRVRVAVIAAVVVLGTLGTALAVGAVADPLADNREVTDQYEQAYQPFEDREFENALVLLPTPYGDWLNHPFQVLRNDPGYDGDAVYALQHRQFAVVDAFPDRTVYRYAYRGQWTPYSGQSVTPRLQRVQAVAGDSVTASLSVGLPQYTEAVEVRVSSGSAGSDILAGPSGDALALDATVADGTVTVSSSAFDGNVSTAVRDNQSVKLTVFVDYGTLGSFEYVARLPVERNSGGYRALTPRLEVCRSPRLCGGEAAYVPGTHREGIWMNTTLTAENLDR
ncbi:MULTISPECIES: glycosyltransferase family 39 protein [Salinibaculum]|uniref:DUF7846 domain-containing protein n=1 Tax=Salinibaculum TaxID=2732368 RepID=UPI0030D1061A